VHGNEFPGPLAVVDLAQRLDPGHLDGTVVLVPIANPLAFNAGTRSSPEDGVNLNRVFPGDPAGSLTLRLAHALVVGIMQDADLAVDLHSATETGHMIAMAGFREPPGPPAEVHRASARAAAAMRLDMHWMMRWAPGTLSTALNERGVPAVGTELGGGGVASPDEVDVYRQGLLRLLGYLGIHGSPVTVDPPAVVEVTDDLLAPTSGLLDLAVGLGDRVRAGERVGSILDPWGGATPLTVPLDDPVSHFRSFRMIRAGDTVVSIAREVPHPAR